MVVFSERIQFLLVHELSGSHMIQMYALPLSVVSLPKFPSFSSLQIFDYFTYIKVIKISHGCTSAPSFMFRGFINYLGKTAWDIAAANTNMV